MKKIIILLCFLSIICGCCVEDDNIITYSDGTTNTVPIIKTDPILELDNIYDKCHSKMYTKVYELDGYNYRIFWIGDGSSEAAMVVINLEEQKAKIKYYNSNSKDIFE